MLKSRLPHIARHPCSYRYLRCRPENKEGTQNTRLLSRKGGQPRELADGPEGAGTHLTTGAERPLRPPFWGQRDPRETPERFLSGSGQQILTGKGPTNTGLSPLVTYITGKLKTPLFLKNPKALLIF